MHAKQPKPSLADRFMQIFHTRKILQWATVQEWIAENLPSDIQNRSDGPRRSGEEAFVELRRVELPDGGIQLTATYALNRAVAEPVLSKTWEADAMDDDLAAMFDNESHTRIDI